MAAGRGGTGRSGKKRTPVEAKRSHHRKRFTLPYGIPWPEQDYVVYRCVICNIETDTGYTPFCPCCGAKQPKQERKDLAGFSRLVRRFHEIAEVQAALDEFRGFSARLWMYCVSHAELQIVFYKTGGERMLLLCVSTNELNLSTSAWKPDLELEEVSESMEVTWGTYVKREVVVRDRASAQFVRCNSVVAYVGYDHSFSGDGLCKW